VFAVQFSEQPRREMMADVDDQAILFDRPTTRTAVEPELDTKPSSSVHLSDAAATAQQQPAEALSSPDVAAPPADVAATLSIPYLTRTYTL